jgi:hypothetical protein
MAGTGDGLTVARWVDSADEDVRVLATIGMSLRPLEVPADTLRRGSRVELVMLARAGDADMLSRLLADLADYPRREKTWLYWFHTLPIGRRVAPRSGLSALYFSMPYFQPGTFFHVRGAGRNVTVLWVLPISERERKYHLQHGSGALEEELEKADFDPTDLRRKSVV